MKINSNFSNETLAINRMEMRLFRIALPNLRANVIPLFRVVLPVTSSHVECVVRMSRVEK